MNEYLFFLEYKLLLDTKTFFFFFFIPCNLLSTVFLVMRSWIELLQSKYASIFFFPVCLVMVSRELLKVVFKIQGVLVM